MDLGFDPRGTGQAMRIYVRFGAFCGGIASFDPEAFGMAPSEAAATDPQHRLLLEEVGAAWREATPSVQDIHGNLTGESGPGGWHSAQPEGPQHH